MRKRHSLKKELTVFILMASLVTLLSVAIAVCYVFFSFFFKNTQEDIEYVLNNTTQQYQSHMQFIEDGAITIRHNSLLESFFQCNEYDSEEAKKQLVYSMELFAERNRVNQQYPFVTSMYLFNNQDQCVKEHYYAITLNTEKEEEIYYQNMQQWFKLEKNRYACVTDRENLNIIFRIYDDNMKEKGIAQISYDAIREIFKEVEDYQDYSWIVLSNKDLMLVSGGDEKQNELMKETSVSWAGNKEIEGRKVIGSADLSGFGARTVIAVGQSNVLAILRPTLFIFSAGLVIVLFFTFCVSYGLSYRFSKPVTRMISNIRAFGKQKLDVRMEDSTIQEFHDIGQVFNEMADRIEYLITEVYEKQLLVTKSQVKYLQSQLNPHFQFNILAMLSLKAKMSGNEELYESLNAFSKLMQGKIFRDKEIKIKVKEELEIVFEDEWLVVVNKPSGMLSVPGKEEETDSVYHRVKAKYPEATGPMIVHRLDMATSGLLLVAKTKEVHQHLQEQFINRSIKKRYVALLDGNKQNVQLEETGTINLPLCLNPLDRPRQMVSEEYGKPAVTEYRILNDSDKYIRIALYPLTGRTHQLRVHAAHHQGLNCPILGDELYGKKADRLYLHAEYIEFRHPVYGDIICIQKEAEF